MTEDNLVSLNDIHAGVFHRTRSSLKRADFKTGNQGDLYAVFVYTPGPCPRPHCAGGRSHFIGLPEDSTTHSGPYRAATIQVVGCHFLVKGDLVQPEPAVLAVCS